MKGENMPKFNKREVTESKKKEIQIVTYTPEEIKELIENDLNKKGYEIEGIQFSTTHKHVVDEWGMNGRYTSGLKSAQVKLK